MLLCRDNSLHIKDAFMSENLNMTGSPQMFRYWGKADPNYPGTPKWHPLV
jgi:hypothetical protein